MDYIDQKVDTIRLFLVEGNPQLEQFVLLAQNSFTLGKFVITFGVLGESHFVNITDGDKNLTEICACSDARFNTEENKVIKQEYLDKLTTLPVRHTWQNFEYAFTYRHIDLKRGMELLSDLRSVTTSGHTMYLQYHFPTEQASDEKPVTEVFIRTTERNFYIRTVHTYPNENLAVHTESSLKLIS